uniref:Conotoxin Superfamily SF10 n=1 Tax=Conus episcopatus TaxID=88764 RepID=A0A0K2S732_CONEP|nr:Conotoxin Superfamily SF10 [Conus episcopatus]
MGSVIGWILWYTLWRRPLIHAGSVTKQLLSSVWGLVVLSCKYIGTPKHHQYG